MKFPSVPKYITNKYSLTFCVLLVWMMFFHDIDIPFMYETRQELNRLEDQTEWYKVENAKAQEALHDLTTNSETLEKFAREEYYMKRDNEDVYVIRAAKD